MPLYLYACEYGHREEHFCHHPDDRGCVTYWCAACAEQGATVSTAPVPSFGYGLTFFGEGSPRTIWNLGPEPITVRSSRDHQEAMRKAGVTWATRGRGQKGCWI